MINGKFYYQVTDDGMSGDGIAIGDIVLIDTQVEVLHDDIVAMTIRSKFMLRRAQRIGEKYTTMPSNPTMFPEVHEDVLILGKVIKNMIII